MILEKNIKISVIAFPSNPYPTIFHSATDWKFCSHFSHNPLRSHISSVCLSREREIGHLPRNIFYNVKTNSNISEEFNPNRYSLSSRNTAATASNNFILSAYHFVFRPLLSFFGFAPSLLLFNFTQSMKFGLFDTGLLCQSVSLRHI